MSLNLCSSGLTYRIWRRSLTTFTMKLTVPRDWTRMEVCLLYPPMTPRKATCNQSVRGKRESKSSAMKLIDRSTVYYHHWYLGIIACLEKHFNLYKSVSFNHGIFVWFPTPPVVFSSFFPMSCPQTHIEPLRHISVIENLEERTVGAIIEIQLYLLPRPSRFSKGCASLECAKLCV